MTTDRHVVSLSTQPAHVLANDAEALAIAADLAVRFADGASDRERGLPWVELDAFSQSGLWSMNVPAAYGGPALSWATIARVFAVVAAGDASIAQIAQNHISILDVIRFDPDEERKRFFFDASLRGLRFGDAQVERGGETTIDIQTRLVRDGDVYRLSIEKFYCTGVLYAHLVPVLALDDAGNEVLAFVDRNARGLEVIDEWSAISQRTTASGAVILDDVHVAADRVVPAHLAFDKPSVHGAIAQIPYAAIDVGIARRAIEETIAFVRTRVRPRADSGDGKVSGDPFLIREIADLQVKLHAAEAVLDRAGRAIDRGLTNENAETAAEASIAVAEAKVLTAELAEQAGNTAIKISGTRPALAALELDRHWRDTRIPTLRDPVCWKFHAIGDYVVNGVKPLWQSRF